MKVNLTYVFDTKVGFRYERETPSEILEIARENYKALKELATGEGDYCDWHIDESKPLFPSGIITAEIDGFHRQYNLTTIVEPITEEETPAEEERNDLNPKMKEALDYMRSQLEDYELDVYCTHINASYEMHSTPTACYDFDHIRDLLDEYGADNDLEEGWWEEYGDLDDWLYEL